MGMVRWLALRVIVRAWSQARIAELAMRHRQPTMHFSRVEVEAGGLLGFGPNLPHMWQNVGKYVDKILAARNPAIFR